MACVHCVRAVDLWIFADLPKTEHLTHVLCSFADTDNTGAVKLIDDNGSAVGVSPQTTVITHVNIPSLHGTVVGRTAQAGGFQFEPGDQRAEQLIRFQLYPLKLKNRTLKTILSIGGGKYSQNGHFAFVTTPSNRATFTNSLITVIEDYGLDGAYVCLILFTLFSVLTQKPGISISNSPLTMNKQLHLQASLPRPGPPSTNWHPAKAIKFLISSPYVFYPQFYSERR